MEVPSGAGVLARFDRWQMRHRVSAVAVATGRRFADDHSPSLAALLAFWGFFSIFPLMLAVTTVVGWLMPGEVGDDVVETVEGYVPLIDFADGGLGGSAWALALGLGTAAWGATRITRTARFAFDSVWDVPESQRAGVGRTTLDGLAAIGLIGLALVLSVLATGLVSGTSSRFDLPRLAVAGGYVVAIAIDVVAFAIVFRLLTSREVSTRTVLPGALLAGVGFWVLQSVSSLVIARYLKNAQATYGDFATVITLLWWFYLTGILTVFGAQLNVVLRDRLWPRSVTGADPPPPG